MAEESGARPAVRVRVPATSANLGPGYDSFGLALPLHDEVVVRSLPAGLRVEVSGEGADEVSRDEQNLVVRALLTALDHVGRRPPGLLVSCCNAIPHGRGLGSSAAAIVAGLVAARGLVPEAAPALDDGTLLRLATELEGHPDNVAACIYGGFTIAWTADDHPYALRLEPSEHLGVVAFVPDVVSSTAAVRRLLPTAVPHVDAAHQVARAALLAHAVTADPALLLVATEDRLHQQYRAAAMGASAGLVAALRAAGVPAVVSGAGPTVLALVDRRTDYPGLPAAVPGFAVRRLSPELRGTAVLDVPGAAPGR